MLTRFEDQTFPGTLDALAPVREFVANVAHAVGFNRSATYKLCLAVDEIATNIVLHGYDEAGLKGNLKIGATGEDDKLVIRMEDQGRSYDPNLFVLPRAEDLTLPLESRDAGKLGIYLTLDGVDELQYTATDTVNIHRFIVLLPPGSGSAP